MSTSPNHDRAPTSPDRDTCDCPTVTVVIYVPPRLRGTDDGSHKRVTETIHRLRCDVGQANEGDNQ